MSSNSSFPSEPLVAVVVPARNAELTLDRTLASIRTQSHANLEIIVVDDCSTDSTPRIALAHAAQDPRVRLVRADARGGVGAARNLGAAATDAPYLAFLDADDLLTPDSIGARLAALIATGAGMAYGWSAFIDAEDRVLEVPVRPTFAGQVFEAMLRGNFIGNGSAILCTRQAVEEAGGYDDAMFRLGAQGCEDYAFYLAVARHFPVACVPRVLIGYRQARDNMSSDGPRMVRSLQMVHADLLAMYPEHRPLLQLVENNARVQFGMQAIKAGRVAKGLRLFAPLGVSFPRRLAAILRARLKAARLPALLPQGARFPYEAPEPGGGAARASP